MKGLRCSFPRVVGEGVRPGMSVCCVIIDAAELPCFVVGPACVTRAAAAGERVRRLLSALAPLVGSGNPLDQLRDSADQPEAPVTHPQTSAPYFPSMAPISTSFNHSTGLACFISSSPFVLSVVFVVGVFFVGVTNFDFAYQTAIEPGCHLVLYDRFRCLPGNFSPGNHKSFESESANAPL